MQYLEITEGPMAHPPRLGVQGTTHTAQNGVVVCDTDFECWVDEGYKGNPDAWVVWGMFLAPQEDGEYSGCTAVVFGNAQRAPFTSFEDAYAFCGAFCGSLYDKQVEEQKFNDVVSTRGLEAFQYMIPSEAFEVSGPEEPETDESEGGTCDVTVGVDLPAKRILH